jgi:hypothetical protein
MLPSQSPTWPDAYVLVVWIVRVRKRSLVLAFWLNSNPHESAAGKLIGCAPSAVTRLELLPALYYFPGDATLPPPHARAGLCCTRGGAFDTYAKYPEKDPQVECTKAQSQVLWNILMSYRFLNAMASELFDSSIIQFSSQALSESVVSKVLL